MATMPVALRDALRALRRSPLYAGMAALSLGLALALNTTVFAVVDAAIRPVLPFDEPDRIHWLMRRGGDRRLPLAFDVELRAVAEAPRAFSHVTYAAIRFASFQSGAHLEDAMISRVPADFFATVGVRPVAGRLFAEGERDVVVIGYALWRRFYASRPLAEGLTLTVGTTTYAVVGVLPRGMHEPAGEVWISGPPAARYVREFGEFPRMWLRARPGVSAAAAQRELDEIARRLSRDFSTPDHPFAYQLRSVRGDPGRRNDLHHALTIAAAAVLVIACANLATLMLARGVARRREVALRMALGASRGHVVRTVLAETGTLALAGAALGALLTLWALYLLATYGTRTVPELGDLAPVPGPRAFAFVLGAAMVAMVLAGVLPAIRMAGADPSSALGDGSGTTTARTRERHGLLVVFQVALGMSLLLGAGLLVSMTVRELGFAFGFDARRLLVAGGDLRRKYLPEPGAATRHYDALEARLRALPGVEEVATRRGGKPDGAYVMSEQGRAGNRWINLRDFSVVSPTYLRTLGVPVVRGRDFAPGDRAGTGAIIIDEEAARRLFPDVRSPVGRMLKLGVHTSRAPWVRVVGVARQVEHGSRQDRWWLPRDPTLYVLAPVDSTTGRTTIVRTERRDDLTLAVEVRRVIQAAGDPRAFLRVRPWLADHDDQVAQATFLVGLFAGFGAFALVLAAVGLSGVLGYMVSRRLREFAVRVALGAQGRDVARIVLRHAAVLVLGGVGVGAIAALALFAGAMDTAFETPWGAAVTLVCVEALVFAAAALAALDPVRRAVKADPMMVMRAN